MQELPEIKRAHEEIQKKLFSMLLEKWDKLYLYASVMERENGIQTGEMFFYYYPNGILKKRAINVYEVPKRFNIDEEQYFKMADDLYNSIKKLRSLHANQENGLWTNMTIVIENLKYKVIYGYDDLNSDDMDTYSRRVIWTYRYLNLPYESLNRKEREVIDTYRRSKKQKETIFEMPLYTKSVNKHIETIKDTEKKFEFVTEEKLEEMEFKNTHVPKSQILITK